MRQTAPAEQKIQTVQRRENDGAPPAWSGRRRTVRPVKTGFLSAGVEEKARGHGVNEPHRLVWDTMFISEQSLKLELSGDWHIAIRVPEFAWGGDEVGARVVNEHHQFTPEVSVHQANKVTKHNRVSFQRIGIICSEYIVAHLT